MTLQRWLIDTSHVAKKSQDPHFGVSTKSQDRHFGVSTKSQELSRIQMCIQISTNSKSVSQVKISQLSLKDKRLLISDLRLAHSGLRNRIQNLDNYLLEN